MKTYQKQVWLNRDSYPSTDSLFIYDGVAHWDTKKRTRCVEISNCQDIVRLHMKKLDSKNDWIEKIETLTKELSKYVEFLK
jgi:hypothetical protein